jgi:hypothetical protein
MLLIALAAFAAEPDVETVPEIPVTFVLDADKPDWMVVPFDKRRELKEPNPLCTLPCQTTLAPGKHKLALLKPNGRPITQGTLKLKPDDAPVVVQARRTKTWALVTYAGLQGAAALFYAAAGGNTDVACTVYDSLGDSSEAAACRARVAAERTQAMSAGLSFQAVAIPFLVLSMPTLLPVKNRKRQRKLLEKSGLTP